MSIFNLENHTQALADYLPNGKMFEAKNIYDSEFRKLLRGFAGELFSADGYLREFEQEYYPATTSLFLDEWESALHVYEDGCFVQTNDLIKRRRNILIKLAMLGIQTIADFKAVADLFGIAVTINSGRDEITFPLTFPVVLFSTLPHARFTIVVRFSVESSNKFPLMFPFIFGNEEIFMLECLYRKARPGNCNLHFIQV